MCVCVCVCVCVREREREREREHRIDTRAHTRAHALKAQACMLAYVRTNASRPLLYTSSALTLTVIRRAHTLTHVRFRVYGFRV